MADYKLSSQAKDYLISINDSGIEKLGMTLADKYFISFYKYFDFINEGPFSFESVNYIKKGYRRCGCVSDCIYYKIINGRVEIMPIIGRQDIKDIFYFHASSVSQEASDGKTNKLNKPVIIMNLDGLGYNRILENWRVENGLADLEIGRVVAEHKERYIVKTATSELDAEITGNLRFTARGREDFPAVGDWVALIVYDSEMAIIHRILPRQSMLSRKAVGQVGEIQIIATNIDFAFLLQAVDRDFNINRLQRYLTIANSSKVSPVIILTKTDLIDSQKIDEITNNIKKRINDVPVIAISNETQAGYEELNKLIKAGKTYCMLGSSGVGKSTLLNNLSGKNLMKTGAISEHANRGKHITSHRELTILKNGAILIDNPGMREVGIADTSEGLETTFDEIIALAEQCKFKDCTHTSETGCAVVKAVESGEIDPGSFENYLKMEREKAHFESSAAERRKRDKQFGKIMKDYKQKDIKGRLY